jgi:THO complex subunit 2
MANSDTSRAKVEPMNARDRHSDIHSSQTKVSPPAGSEGLTTNLGSLRSRIGEKEPPSSSSYRGESSRNDDDRESSRKRTVSGKSNLLS